jgi:uncharacterized protein YgiM (DUF1202 family)
MKSKILIGIVALLVLALVGLVLKTKVFSGPAYAALKVSSDPRATVFVDGNQVGQTPFYNDKIKSGEHTVKIVPDNSGSDSVLEKKVNLVSTVLTVVDYTFGSKQSDNAGQILSLDKISSRDKAALSIISDPDQAVVKVNGDPKGFSPVMLENLDPGNYTLSISSPGYEERTIPNASLIAGYQLKVEVKLAQKIEGFEEASSSGQTLSDQSATVTPETSITPTGPAKKTTPTPTPKATPTSTSSSDNTGSGSSDTVAKPYVLVKSTPTGFLRVRSTPDATSSDNEIGQAKPGDKLPYLGKQQSGWYQVTFNDQTGWVSGTYVQLVQ